LQSLIPGQKNVVNTPLMNPEKVHLPPLHIKLGLKKMDQYSAGFMYLKNKFPGISEAKIKEWIFVGPQIRESIQEVKFEYQLSEVEKSSQEIIQKRHYLFFRKS
jgi:hypothetical protein